MSEQERPKSEEPKEKAPKIAEEAIEGPKFDAEYASATLRYFNERIKRETTGGKPEESAENKLYEQLLSQDGHSLAKMANPKLLEKIQPKDVSFALAKLTGMMAKNNLADPNNQGEYIESNPDVAQRMEKEYLDSKKVFMNSCEKLFPGIEINLNPATINREMIRINKVEFVDNGHSQTLGIEEIPVSEIQKMIKENPKELLQKIDKILYFVGNEIDLRAYQRFMAVYKEGENPNNLDADEKSLAVLLGALYKLQLTKDEIIKVIYGRPDITPSERNEVDKATSDIK